MRAIARGQCSPLVGSVRTREEIARKQGRKHPHQSCAHVSQSADMSSLESRCSFMQVFGEMCTHSRLPSRMLTRWRSARSLDPHHFSAKRVASPLSAFSHLDEIGLGHNVVGRSVGEAQLTDKPINLLYILITASGSHRHTGQRYHRKYTACPSL